MRIVLSWIIGMVAFLASWYGLEVEGWFPRFAVAFICLFVARMSFDFLFGE